MNNRFCIAVPCFNEAEVLKSTAEKLKNKVNELIKKGKMSADSSIMFIDDGSTDGTFDIITELNNTDSIFTGILLSCNKGHQNALFAGLTEAKENYDAVISIDADLQDDINAIEEMTDKFLDGAEIVYGIRNKRSTDTFLKRFTAEAYYRFLNILGVKIHFNHADFRLLSKRAISELENFKEVNLFLRGIIPMIGLKSDFVYYERKSRTAGKSKYSVKKMFDFAADGITSLSIKPLRLIFALGVIITFAALILAVTLLIKRIMGIYVAVYYKLVMYIALIGGLNLTALGVVGEYLGKVLSEVRARPKYIVEKRLDNKKEQ